MDIWTIIGIVSSVLGIYSFVKNDTPLFKKLQKVTHYITVHFLKKSNVFKKLIQIIQNYLGVFVNTHHIKKSNFVAN